MATAGVLVLVEARGVLGAEDRRAEGIELLNKTEDSQFRTIKRLENKACERGERFPCLAGRVNEN
jgi:hypothetical protein